ncbi:MAG: signal peptidase I [Dehalococcoidia bacterium]|jgi:signal peptidase I
MKNFIAYLFIALAATVAALFCIELSFKTFEVFDISMEPTYQAGDFILVNRLAYIWDTPKRGDVIALYSPENTERLSLNPFETQDSSQYIKRIIAVQGDTVDIENQKVYVNGNLIDEPYIMEPCDYDCNTQKIPAGSYFVLGDNRNHSDDSHRGWLTSRSDIIGKVCLTYWHSDYPDIHVVLIPIFFVVVGALSKDTLIGLVKRIVDKSHS